MNVKDEVLALLQNKEWVSVEDFENLFPPKMPGHLSWGQRLRQLRTEGFSIEKRLKENCKHTFEYHLVIKKEPEPIALKLDHNQFCFAK